MKLAPLQSGFPSDVKARHWRALVARSLRQILPLRNLGEDYFYSLLMSAGKFTLICDPIHQSKENTRDNEGKVDGDSPNSSFTNFCFTS